MSEGVTPYLLLRGICLTVAGLMALVGGIALLLNGSPSAGATVLATGLIISVTGIIGLRAWPPVASVGSGKVEFRWIWGAMAVSITDICVMEWARHKSIEDGRARHLEKYRIEAWSGTCSVWAHPAMMAQVAAHLRNLNPKILIDVPYPD